MRLRLSRLLSGLWVLGFGAVTAAAAEPVYATPLPPGPGVLPQSYPNAPLTAPVIMPAGATTAAPATACVPEACDAPKSRRFYAAADFLYGATQGVFVPPLVTAGPSTAPLGQAGALFSP